MCHPKNRVLKKGTPKPTYESEEEINVNMGFKNNNIRVMVFPIENKQEKEAKIKESNTQFQQGIAK